MGSHGKQHRGGTARHKISVGKQTTSITSQLDTRGNLKRSPNDPSGHSVDLPVRLSSRLRGGLVGRGLNMKR